MNENLINSELLKYIKEDIFKVYDLNGVAHNIDHIKYVLERAFEISKQYDGLDYNILFTAVSYHDIGDHIDRKTHEIISANWMWNDENLDKFFNKEQKKTIKEAIEDHRASNKNVPRNIYGKILASADKNVDVNIFLERTLAFGLEHYKELSIPQQIDRAYEHASDKYGKNGYAVDKFYVKDDKYSIYLNELQNLIENKSEFYKKAENILKQMIDK